MNPSRSVRLLSLRLGSVVALAAMSFMAPSIAAQEGDEAHPAHIHAGTCEALGDVVLPLTDIAPPPADAEISGHESAHAVKIGETEVDMPLQEIVDGGHAINVHLSADEIDTYIACGDIGGAVMENADGRTSLVIGLGELNGSGNSGVAWLGADGDVTEVVIMLIKPEEMGGAGAEASPEVSPAAAASAEAAAVEIKGFAFNPPTIEVPVGGTVTWTNQDNAPHTATALDRAVLQSGPITFGESYTQTFDTAGTYDYFCEFHANMKGSIVVE